MKIDYKELFEIEPYSVSQIDKEPWFFKNIKKLSNHHYKNCDEYRKLANKIFMPISKCVTISDIPYTPSSLFKTHTLKSEILNNSSKVFTSSGTSGSTKSKIVLDKKTSLLQSRALSKIYASLVDKGIKIFFIDSEDIINGSKSMSARGAAIKGFYQFVRNPEYLLDKNGNINIAPVKKFVSEFPNEKFIIFGFTSLIWFNLIAQLKNKKIRIKKNNGVLIHGGGWKKLYDKKVDRKKFNAEIKSRVGIDIVHNYYGMIEQTGSIFLECEKGFYHASIFSDIIVRGENLEPCAIGQKGLIQVISLLPLSYPGHNILTEDIGKLEGFDNCTCGRKGKFFSIDGRVSGTELRGCSDVGP